MREEVDAASRWWTTQLGKTVSDEQILETFRRCLGEVMTERYTGHWYEDDRLRGSGFRSVSFDNRIDPMLITAAKRAGIDGKQLMIKEKSAEPSEVDKVMAKLLDHARGKIMFVNPGEVKLANAALLSAPARCIWDRTNGAAKNGADWDEELTPSYKTQFDAEEDDYSLVPSVNIHPAKGDTFESPLASPPSTPHIAPVATSSNALPSPTKAPLPAPSNNTAREFYPAHQPSFKIPAGLDEARGSTSSSEPSPSGAGMGPFSHSLSHNHNLNLTHSHTLNLKNGVPPRQTFAPPPHTPSHINGPSPHTVSAHNHHTAHPHHTAHANLGGGR